MGPLLVCILILHAKTFLKMYDIASFIDYFSCQFQNSFFEVRPAGMRQIHNFPQNPCEINLHAVFFCPHVFWKAWAFWKCITLPPPNNYSSLGRGVPLILPNRPTHNMGKCSRRTPKFFSVLQWALFLTCTLATPWNLAFGHEIWECWWIFTALGPSLCLKSLTLE